MHIEWDFNGDSSSLTRFRLLYNNNENNSNLVLHEWPGIYYNFIEKSDLLTLIFVKFSLAQLTKPTKYFIINQNYSNYYATSTFECYNECIRNPSCVFAVFQHTLDNIFNWNCVLKLLSGSENNTEKNFLNSYVTLNDDKEVIIVSGLKLIYDHFVK